MSRDRREGARWRRWQRRRSGGPGGHRLLAAGAGGRAAAGGARRECGVGGARGRGRLPDVELGCPGCARIAPAALTARAAERGGGGRTVRVRTWFTARSRRCWHVRGGGLVARPEPVPGGMPLVLADDRWLDFDRRASECDYLTGEGASGASPSCVNETSSTLLRDGILPGFGMARYGLDRAQPAVRAPVAPRVPGAHPARAGVPGLRAQLGILNQRRDDTRPTWVVRLEPRFALGKEMGFDPLDPRPTAALTPVTTSSCCSTSFSRRTPASSPTWAASTPSRRPPAASPYGDFPLGEKGFSDPQHRAGAEAGFEYVGLRAAPRRPQGDLRAARPMELRFFGLARSELWEPLSGPGTCRSQPRHLPPGDRSRPGRRRHRPSRIRASRAAPATACSAARSALTLEIARWLRLHARGRHDLRAGPLPQRRALGDRLFESPAAACASRTPAPGTCGPTPASGSSSCEHRVPLLPRPRSRSAATAPGCRGVCGGSAGLGGQDVGDVAGAVAGGQQALGARAQVGVAGGQFPAVGGSGAPATTRVISPSGRSSA